MALVAAATPDDDRMPLTFTFKLSHDNAPREIIFPQAPRQNGANNDRSHNGPSPQP
jgi:hypothetical protein